MKLLSLNCWSGKLATQIKRLEKKTKPDFVCLQEAYCLTPRPGSTFAPPNELFPENIYPYSYFGKVFSARTQKELADFGNIVISKKKASGSEIIYTRGQPFDDLEILNGDDYNVRNFVHCSYTSDNKTLHILTHHGYHDPDSKEGSPENTRQMQIIADYIDKLDGPVVLTGDFNLHPKSESLVPIHSRLINLCTKYKISSTRNELAKRSEVIDYIFVSDDVIVNNFYVPNMIVSDHKALFLDFKI